MFNRIKKLFKGEKIVQGPHTVVVESNGYWEYTSYADGLSYKIVNHTTRTLFVNVHDSRTFEIAEAPSKEEQEESINNLYVSDEPIFFMNAKPTEVERAPKGKE